MSGSFEFATPTRLVVGAGRVAEAGGLARELGMQRVLLVTDPGLAATPHLARLQASLRAAGCELACFAETHANPTTRDVAACLALAQSFAPDGFVALGGGSSIDTAKATNLLLTNGGELATYRGRSRVAVPLLPQLVIPTTAGTGSEVQAFCLIADEASHMKMACGTASAIPAVAILDAELTLTLPRSITASAGIDAISHAVECAVTTARTPLSELAARDAFARLHVALPQVLAAPQDLAARAEMLLGATLAGIAIENSMLGAAHAMANPLTAHFGLVHGLAVAACLPAVVACNRAAPEAAAGYAALARAGGLASAAQSVEQAVDALQARLLVLTDAVGARAALRDAGCDPGLIPVLAAEAACQWTGTHNPLPLTADGFATLYAQVLA